MTVQKASDPEYKLNVARRLRLTRVALELSQAELCRQTGIQQQVWNNAETGDNRLAVSAAGKLYRTYRVNFDWVYLGIKGGLPGDLASKIAKLERDGA